VLDVEDPIDREYHLEVSSPGIDRPLLRARDFIAYVGHEAKIELTDLLDGRKRFRGLIVAADAETFTIKLPEAPKGTDPNVVLPLALLAEAKLVMTDALMNMARADQDEFPLLDDPEIETIEDAASDEKADAEDIEPVERDSTEDNALSEETN
jgi:ribosome maturation factor RimP